MSDGPAWDDLEPARIPWRLIVGLTTAVIVGFIGYALATEPDPPPPATAPLTSSGGGGTSSGGGNAGGTSSVALDQMAVAFEGGYSRAAIEARMREGMELYGLAWTEDNRSRAGSTLVALRREYSIEEMRILDYMICSHVPGVEMSFPEMAGIAVALLDSGDGCR